MTRAQLEHIIRAACAVADDTEVIVIGSQAILGQFPRAPAALVQSLEAEVYPKNHPERAELIDGALVPLGREERRDPNVRVEQNASHAPCVRSARTSAIAASTSESISA